MQQPTDQSADQRKDVSGQYLDIALRWPLIHPRKVFYIYIYTYKNDLKMMNLKGEEYGLITAIKSGNKVENMHLPALANQSIANR